VWRQESDTLRQAIISCALRTTAGKTISTQNEHPNSIKRASAQLQKSEFGQPSRSTYPDRDICVFDCGGFFLLRLHSGVFSEAPKDLF
jgi:hypothetical protein